MDKIKTLKTTQDTQNFKADRKIYVGNLPQNLKQVDNNQFIEFFNKIYQQIKPDAKPNEQAIGAWMSPDGHYAFVEFKGPDETTNALNKLNDN